jgi:hypothetical protein
MRIQRPSFNVIELAMFASLIAVLGYFAGGSRMASRLTPYLSSTVAELQPLAERYGEQRNSRHGEESIGTTSASAVAACSSTSGPTVTSARTTRTIRETAL